MKTRIGWGSAATLLGALVLACGGTDGSEFGTGQPTQIGPVAQITPGTLPSDLQACATAVANGNLVPVNLVIMFDRSGSMAYTNPILCTTASQCTSVSSACYIPPGLSQGYCADLMDSKWVPAKDALTSFLGDASSSGMKASLDTFAKAVNNPDAACSVSSYYTSPLVGLQTLPNATPFRAALDGTYPDSFTPTYPALDGALRYAKQNAPTGERSVVLLVTDGEPYNGKLPNGQVRTSCGDGPNTPEGVAQLASTYSAQGILTYVIGVGLDTTNLNKIAQGGGTGEAIPVTVGSPSQTRVGLLSALNKIRGQIGSCSFTVPQPPAGETIDYGAVNVDVNGQVVSYSKDCATGAGWHYDDPSSPKRIDLCPSTCDLNKQAGKGNVSIAFGCATKGGVIR